MTDQRLLCEAERADGIDPSACLTSGVGDAFFATHPDDGVALGARGVVATVTAEGPGRFEQAATAARTLLTGIDCRTPDAPLPVVLGGFAFHDQHAAGGWWDGFPPLRFVLPAETIVQRDGETWRLRIRQSGEASLAQPAPVPACPTRAASPDDWKVRVRRALADIEAGRLEKLVLARSRDVSLLPVDAVALVRRLAGERPGCTTFLVRRGGTTFLGSTPESLVRLAGDTVEAVALAGSLQPEPGEPVGRAARRLLACPKNAAEHAFVADAIATGLAGACEHVAKAEARRVRLLPEVLHLATTFRGRVAPGMDVLRLAGRLHPTPAVAGVPQRTALERLAAAEPDRGWYAGGIGWMDASGDGRMVVALRCALLRGDRARLWAGAGIVAGSDPDAEWEETEAKMSAMRRVLAERARAA